MWEFPGEEELQHLVVTAVKAAFDLHFHNKALLFWWVKGTAHTSPCWVLYCLEEAFLIHLLQESPVFLVLMCYPTSNNSNFVDLIQKLKATET